MSCRQATCHLSDFVQFFSNWVPCSLAPFYSYRHHKWRIEWQKFLPIPWLHMSLQDRKPYFTLMIESNNCTMPTTTTTTTQDNQRRRQVFVSSEFVAESLQEPRPPDRQWIGTTLKKGEEKLLSRKSRRRRCELRLKLKVAFSNFIMLNFSRC